MNTALVTGPGAVRFTGPATSCVEQEPDRADLVGEADPAHPLLAGAELAEQPEACRAGQPLAARRRWRSSTMPVRMRATRMPGGLGRRRRPPPRPRTTSARKPVPGLAGLGELLVAAVAVEADGRARTPARAAWSVERRQRVGQQARCPSCGSRGSVRFCSSVQRFSAMPSPARCTTPSSPSRPAASMSPALDVPANGAGAAVRRAPRGRRGVPVGLERARPARVPISPLDPVMAMRIGGYRTGPRRPDRPDRRRIQCWTTSRSSCSAATSSTWPSRSIIGAAFTAIVTAIVDGAHHPARRDDLLRRTSREMTFDDQRQHASATAS